MKQQKAYLAMGCFWGPEDHFSQIDGVVDTRVGYAGGDKEDPTYEDLGNHTETVAITYDSEQITFGDLLDQFWQLHNPTMPSKPQYQSIIFYTNQEQKQAAEASLADEQKQYDREIVTDIRSLEEFYEAEDYHQNYLQKRRSGVL